MGVDGGGRIGVVAPVPQSTDQYLRVGAVTGFCAGKASTSPREQRLMNSPTHTGIPLRMKGRATSPRAPQVTVDESFASGAMRRPAREIHSEPARESSSESRPTSFRGNRSRAGRGGGSSRAPSGLRHDKIHRIDRSCPEMASLPPSPSWPSCPNLTSWGRTRAGGLWATYRGRCA